MNQSFINRIKQDKYFAHLNTNSSHNPIYQFLFINSDRWRYGDLYGISYLPKFKKELEPFKIYDKKGNIKNDKILYIIGDSFLADKKINRAFDQFDNLIFLDRRFPLNSIILDSTKQNYLLLEFAERNLIDYRLGLVKAIRTNPKLILDSTSGIIPQKVSNIKRVFNILFNKDLSRNIELLIFDHKWTTPFKEAKAYINYKIFCRTANEVTMSTDGTRLFLSTTTNVNSSISAFKPIENTKIDSISIELNQTKRYFKQNGFKDVYLSIIPNPVSIYDSKEKRYNNLLNRIEEKTSLATIKTFDLYRNSKKNMFYVSDSHWNPDGLDLWIKTVNLFLIDPIFFHHCTTL